MVKHGAKVVQAKGEAVETDVAFRELIGSPELKDRAKADVIVVHDARCADEDRDQEGAGAFQQALPPA